MAHCIDKGKYGYPPTMDKCLKLFVSKCVIFTLTSMNTRKNDKYDWKNQSIIHLEVDFASLLAALFYTYCKSLLI